MRKEGVKTIKEEMIAALATVMGMEAVAATVRRYQEAKGEDLRGLLEELEVLKDHAAKCQMHFADGRRGSISSYVSSHIVAMRAGGFVAAAYGFDHSLTTYHFSVPGLLVKTMGEIIAAIEYFRLSIEPRREPKGEGVQANPITATEIDALVNGDVPAAEE